jgi:regulator of replication initiation timing
MGSELLARMSAMAAELTAMRQELKDLRLENADLRLQLRAAQVGKSRRSHSAGTSARACSSRDAMGTGGFIERESVRADSSSDGSD